MGLMVAIAEGNILHQASRINLLEWASAKIKRVVRISMGVGVSAATTAFEHGDFVRVMLAEMWQHDFELRMWRRAASVWRQFSVIDAKCAYDSVNSELLPSDRRVAIDVAVLREALLEPEAHGFMRLVPGPQMLADALTKLLPNGVLDAVMQDGLWSLKEDPVLAGYRAEAREHQKKSKAKLKLERAEETKDIAKEADVAQQPQGS